MAALVMGVLNVTPDSFYDGGRYFDPDAALAHGLELVAEGADIIDVGGESTRPGASPVAEAEELRRVLPVVEALAPHVRVSIDTMKAHVAEKAIERGATLVNDVSNSLAELAAGAGVGYVAMHMRGTPEDMQRSPHYDDVVGEVFAMLADAAATARRAGVQEVYVDPGIGFGKTMGHNLALLHALPRLVAQGEDVLVGTSRKSFLGRLAAGDGAPDDPTERLEGSIATAVWSVMSGASIVRVHDVGETVQALRLLGEREANAAVGAAK